MAKKNKKKKIYIIGGIIAIGALVFFSTRNNNKEVFISVVTEQPIARTLIETVDATGKVFPAVEVEITSNVSGTLVELLVKEGDYVQAGQLLARVDPEAIASMVERVEASTSTARAQLQSVRAQKEQLEAQFKTTEANYKRNEQLLKEGVISKAEFETALASYETALANLKAAEENIIAAQFSVKSAEASVKEQKKSLSQTMIYAPIEGIVAKLYKKRGEQVVGTAQMAGTPILNIANLNAVEVRVDVNERDILSVSLNDTATIELDAYPNRIFDGLVTQIANTASNASTSLTSDQVTNFEVRMRILPESYADLQKDAQKSPFRSGMSATTKIRTNTLNNVLSIPVGAVALRQKIEAIDSTQQNTSTKNNMQEYVFEVQGDSIVMLPVKTGAQDDTYLEIKEGLTNTKNIVVEPYDAISKTLNNGTKVKVVTLDELYNKPK